MIELYTSATPNGHKASVTLEELDLNYEVFPINLGASDQKTPEFLAMNPNGRIPVIRDREADHVIFESGAIMIYLAEKTGRLLPTTEPGRSKVLQWLMFQIAGIGPAQAARIKAALEFGRRLVSYVPGDRCQIRGPADAAQLLMAEMSLLEQEHLRLVLLDTKNYVLSVPTIYVGSVNAGLLRVGELFRYALKHNCVALIVVHNHPSGDPTPSPDDVVVTHKIIQGGQMLDIEVLDHVILGQGRFVSLKERGLAFS